MNPCPCGYLGDPNGRCHCTAEQVARYRSRISGPLLDRIDMHLEVPRIPVEQLTSLPTGESSDQVRDRVVVARERQIHRTGKINALLSTREIDRDCPLGTSEQALIRQAIERLALSARAYHRILKLARTIADLAQSDTIGVMHLGEAIGYRQLDRGIKG